MDMYNFTNATTEMDNCSTLNIKTELDIFKTHIPAVITFSKIISPIWWAIGIVGNIMALLVWLQPKMRHSSGCYLAALAITDICCLIFNIVFDMHYTHEQNILDKPVLCQWFVMSFLAVQYMSPVFVLAFTVERYLSVCHPFRMVNFNQSNIKGTILVILGLALFCVSLHGVQGFFWSTKHSSTDQEICNIRSTVMASGVYTVYTWTVEMLIFAAVPIAVLLLNILVIVEVRNISNLERQNMRTNSIDKRSTTLMLLGVSFYLIFTVLPVTVVIALYDKFGVLPTINKCLTDEHISNDSKWKSCLSYYSAKIIVESIGKSHYSVNFYIYVFTGKVFRKQLYEMLAPFCCKGKLLYISAKTGVFTSTRTTRMSMTSHRGSIAKGRLNGTVKYGADPCNNDADVGNRNASSGFSTTNMEVSTMNNSGNVVKHNSAGIKLLSCVEESDADQSDKEDVGSAKSPDQEAARQPLNH